MALEAYMYSDPPTSEAVKEMILSLVGSTHGNSAVPPEEVAGLISGLLPVWDTLRESETGKAAIYLNRPKMLGLWAKMHKKAHGTEFDFLEGDYPDYLPETRAPGWLVVWSFRIELDHVRQFNNMLQQLHSEQGCDRV